MVDRRLKLSTVVARGDRADSLAALANKLAEVLDVAPPENFSALAGQLRATLADLAAVEKPERSKTDELTKKREARREKASVSASSGRGKQRGRRGS